MTETQSEHTALLKIENYHLSKGEAKKYLINILRRHNIDNPVKKIEAGKKIEISLINGNKINFCPNKSIKDAVNTGVCWDLHYPLDLSDELAEPVAEIAVRKPPKGLKVEFTAKSQGHEQTFKGGGINQSPEWALAEDVLFYREKAAVEHNPKIMSRHYRAYLQSSISLVDAFIANTKRALAQKHTSITNKSEYKTLNNPAKLHEKLNALLKLMNSSLDDFKKDQINAWNNFERLRIERNNYVHPSKPAYQIAIKDIPYILNCCQDGLGGLMQYFRQEYGCQHHTIPIHKLLSAPKISLIKT